MPILSASAGLAFNPSALEQSDVKWAVGVLKAGEGSLKKGTLLAIDPSDHSKYVKLDPDDTGGKQYCKGILLEDKDATSEDKNAKIGYFGTFNYSYTMVMTKETFSGDGTTTTFYLSHAPLQGTVTVKVDGAYKTENVDYTVNYETGGITFDEAPPSGTNNIEVTYGYAPPNAVIEEAMDRSIWIVDIIG